METHSSPHAHAPPPRGSFSSLLNRRSPRRKVPFPGRLYHSFLALSCPYCSFPFSSPYPLLIFVANHIAARGQGEREAFSYCVRPGDSNESNSTCFCFSISISPSTPPPAIKYLSTSVHSQPQQTHHRASLPFLRGLLGPLSSNLLGARRL